jgi:hypothetical protein
MPSRQAVVAQCREVKVATHYIVTYRIPYNAASSGGSKTCTASPEVMNFNGPNHFPSKIVFITTFPQGEMNAF